MNEKVAQKLLTVFLDADLHYQLNGTPYHVYLERQAKRHLGLTRRLILRVAALGPDAKQWMDIFIKSMEEE